MSRNWAPLRHAVSHSLCLPRMKNAALAIRCADVVFTFALNIRHGMKAMEQAFKSADLLLQGSGGFGLLILDLGGFVRRVPLSTWFR